MPAVPGVPKVPEVPAAAAVVLRARSDYQRGGQLARNRRRERRAFAIEEARIDRRVHELRMLENLQQERDVGADAEDGVIREAP